MTISQSRNSLNAYQALVVGQQAYTYYSLQVAEQTLGDLSHLPCSMRIILENLLRHEDGINVTVDDMRALTAFHALQKAIPTISFKPIRLLLNDETGVSTLTDIAALIDAIVENGSAKSALSSACHTDITIDSKAALAPENGERLKFLKWAEKTIGNLRLLPPQHGSAGQINFDALSSTVAFSREEDNGVPLIVPDSVMSNISGAATAGCLGVLVWRAEGLELESQMLNNVSRFPLPGIIGIKLTGKIHKGVRATDIALSIAQVLSKNDCHGKIVEFYGPALDHLGIEDRAQIASFAVSAGALSAFFPIDSATLAHLSLTGHESDHVALVEAYAKTQGLWRESAGTAETKEPTFTTHIPLSLESIRPALGGPNNLCLFLTLPEIPLAFERSFPKATDVFDPLATVKHGDIVLAKITARHATQIHDIVSIGLLARKAKAHGLRIKPWLHAVLEDFSPVTLELLDRLGLRHEIEALGLQIKNDEATKITQAAPLIAPDILKTIEKNKLAVCSLSNEAIEAAKQLHPMCAAHYITTSLHVIGYALAGSIFFDLATKTLGANQDGKTISFKDILPTSAEIAAALENVPLTSFYQTYQQSLLTGPAIWEQIPYTPSPQFGWYEGSCLIKRPPFLHQKATGFPWGLYNIKNARILALLGDDVPASNLEPSGVIAQDGPAGYYLATYNQPPETFQSYDSRTGNIEVMARGAFMSGTQTNALLSEKDQSRGTTLHLPDETTMTIFDAAENYRRENVPVILVAGKSFGHGHGQEWAAKSLRQLGVRLVIAESIDPAFSLNLMRMGVLPVILKSGVTLKSLGLTGKELVNFAGIPDLNQPKGEIMMTIEHADTVDRYMVVCDVRTEEDIKMLRNGSLLATTLKKYIPLAV